VGLEHYRAVLEDGRFWHALRNAFAYCGLVLLLVPPLGLLLAHGLRSAWGGRALRGPVQFCLMLPGLTPPLVLALLYVLVFSGPRGLLNHFLLQPFGLPNVDWIRDPLFIKPSLALLALWRWTGFVTLIFLSALESLPRAYYDAARTEGANGWQAFRHVSLPLLRPVTAFVAAFLFLDAFVLFEGAYVLLGGSGGALDAGLLPVSYAYFTAFTLGSFGSASAMAFAVMPALLFALWLILAGRRRAPAAAAA
jgi:ABC-type sugar transport system permease subunit